MVVFPTPFGPTSAVTVPVGTLNETFSMGVVPSGYENDTDWISIATIDPVDLQLCTWTIRLHALTQPHSYAFRPAFYQ